MNNLAAEHAMVSADTAAQPWRADPEKGFWLLASRRRPHLLRRFFAANHAAGGSTRIIVLIDHVDLAAHRDAYAEVAKYMPVNCQIFSTAAESQGGKIREFFETCPAEVATADWIGKLGDDHVPGSLRWDVNMIEALVGWNFVSCIDNWMSDVNKAVIAGSQCWSGPLVRRVGWLYAPGLEHAYDDNMWADIGKQTECYSVLRNVVVGHEDPNRDGIGDETTKRSYSALAADEKVYRTWFQHDLGATIERVYDLMREMGVALDGTSLAGLSLLIATPVGDGKLDREYVRAILDTVERLKVAGAQVQRAELPFSPDVALARSKLLGAFYRSDFSHMLMVDDDMGWDWHDVIRMLRAGKDFVAAAGRRKIDGEAQFAFRVTDDPDARLANLVADPADGSVEVAAVGAAFIMISRRMVERMIEAYPDALFETEHRRPEFALFDPMIVVDHAGARRRLSEDFAFCKRWRDIGGKIHLLPDVRLKHSGTSLWEGAVTDSFMVPMTAVPVPVAAE